jgi:hypothetical protein
MRDHHAFSARLRTRWMRAARPLRSVDRVFANPSAPRFTSVRHVHSHAHVVFATALNHTRLALATALSAPRCLHTTMPSPVAPNATTVIAHTARPGVLPVIAHTARPDVLRPPTPDPSREPRTLPPTLGAVQRVPAPHRRERTVLRARQETHVARVTCVVPKPAAVRGPTDELARPVAARTPPPSPWPPQMTPQPTAPTPSELATITDHVLTAIDRRLIARNERLGRG